MANLKIVAGENIGNSYSFEDSVTLGRSPEADVVIKDLRASRKHLKIICNHGNYFLEDLSSQNGTFLNGEKVESVLPIKNNDRIRIGTTWIEFTSDEISFKENGIFGDYKIIKEISNENIGIIYLAEQTSLNRNVLLWVLSSDFFGEDEFNQQVENDFISQISKMATLSNRNILMLLDFSTLKNYFYCAFENINFKSHLKKYIDKNSPLPIETVLNIATQIADGLKYTHNLNILHLHLSSQNILIQKDINFRAIITQIGVSNFVARSTVTHYTNAKFLRGYEYIAPEQIKSNCIENKQTDIYAYGCMLYHIITGELPFYSDNPLNIPNFHLEKDIVPIQEKRKDVPESLCKMIEKCLEKEQNNRYNSFEEILEILKSIDIEIEIEEAIKNDSFKALVEEEIGKKVLLRWWIIFPFISFLLSILLFFIIPVLKK